MKIYFVRHGHPNYKDDCLTPLGHRQAEAAALRLADAGIEQIYASTCGRAWETAGYTARRLGLDVVPCDFMREISWSSIDETELPQRGNPWLMAAEQANCGTCFTHPDWAEREPYCHSRMVECCAKVAAGIDNWLAGLGYTREGDYYRVGEGNARTVAMFSHGGSSSAAMSHMVNLPFPQFCGTFLLDFPSITVMELSDEPGRLAAPVFRTVNDARHIAGLDAELVFGN